MPRSKRSPSTSPWGSRFSSGIIPNGTLGRTPSGSRTAWAGRPHVGPGRILEGSAKGAVRHAKYKELPAVRARRIKGLEADLRKQRKEKAKAEAGLKLWTSDLTLAQARFISGNSEAGYLPVAQSGQRVLACLRCSPARRGAV